MMVEKINLGLIGWPLAHSLSPALHQAALNVCGWSGDYKLYPLPPLPEGKIRLLELLEKLRRGELDGLNVTIPHKLAVIPFIDELTPVARAVVAVNTIIRHGGHLVGENTDVRGFSEDITQRVGTAGQGSALVLGAGGGARAVVYALACEGWQVYVTARKPQQAERLAAGFMHLSPAPIALNGWLAAFPHGIKKHIELLVNATPVGMSSQENASLWPEHLPLPEGCFVYDLVYDPLETPLLQKAREQGLRTANGLGMLVEQATRAFMLWTNVPEAEFPKIHAAMHHAVSTKEEVR